MKRTAIDAAAISSLVPRPARSNQSNVKPVVLHASSFLTHRSPFSANLTHAPKDDKLATYKFGGVLVREQSNEPLQIAVSTLHCVFCSACRSHAPIINAPCESGASRGRRFRTVARRHILGHVRCSHACWQFFCYFLRKVRIPAWE